MTSKLFKSGTIAVWAVILGAAWVITMNTVIDNLYNVINSLDYRLADGGTHEVISWVLVNNRETLIIAGLFALVVVNVGIVIKIWKS